MKGDIIHYHCEVLWIQHIVINFFSDLWKVGDFHHVFRLLPPIKLSTTTQLKYC